MKRPEEIRRAYEAARAQALVRVAELGRSTGATVLPLDVAASFLPDRPEWATYHVRLRKGR